MDDKEVNGMSGVYRTDKIYYKSDYINHLSQNLETVLRRSIIRVGLENIGKIEDGLVWVDLEKLNREGMRIYNKHYGVGEPYSLKWDDLDFGYVICIDGLGYRVYYPDFDEKIISGKGEEISVWDYMIKRLVE